MPAFCEIFTKLFQKHTHFFDFTYFDINARAKKLYLYDLVFLPSC